jgi:hypothetical protein
MSDPNQIAAGLTEVQRETLKRFHRCDERRMGGYGRDSGCPELVERVGINHPIFGSHYQLTPLGWEVRAIIERDSNGK